MRRSLITPIILVTIGLLLLPADSNIAANALPDGWKPYLWLAWPTGLLMAAPLIYIEVRERHRPRAQHPDAAVSQQERLDRAARELATVVRSQWAQEIGLRSLRSPEPIRVRWSSVDRPVAADLSRVLIAEGLGSQLVRVRGEIQQIVEVFRQVAARQLVILGAPASGKSVAAMLLTLGLPLDEPVPVLLPVGSWNPHLEDLHTWVARRIVEEYPALANQSVYGPDAPARLITSNQVVPVLDGLDEMAAALQPAAIAALDRTIADRHPLIVTCRSAEYRAAVNANGRILAHAAVLEIQPVDIDDAAGFLTAADPRPERWRALVEHVRAHPDGPLARTLYSPLMIDLARAVYCRPGADPGELLDTSVFPDQSRLEHHLFGGFLAAAYHTRAAPPGSQPGSTLRRYPKDRASAWLRFLAIDLTRLGCDDLAWWQLEHAVPRAARGVCAGLLAALIFGLTGWWSVGPTFALDYALTFGLAAGFAFAFGRTHRPSRIKVKFRGRGRSLLLRCAASLALGLGLLPVGGLVDGLTGAITIALALAIHMWLDSPSDATSAASPASVLNQDRAGALAFGVVLALVYGPLPALALGQTTDRAAHSGWVVTGLIFTLIGAARRAIMGGFVYQRTGALAFGIAGAAQGWLNYASGYDTQPRGPSLAEGFGFALCIGVMTMGSRAWGALMLTRPYLVLRGQSPLRLMRFLDDAHQRGVLRQSGTVYQFRHESLKNYISTHL